MGINLNGDARTIEGNSWIDYTTALNNGFSTSVNDDWSGNITTWTPSTDTDTTAMLNTTIYQNNGSFTMTQTIANGDYSLYFWIGENFRENARSFNINLEGTTVASDVGTMPMNTWVKLGPFNVTVSDGVLNMEFEQITFDPHCAGLAIFNQSTLTPTPAGTPTPTPTATPTPTPTGAFVMGINLNGDARTIEGDSWIDYTTALNNGFSTTTDRTYIDSITWSPSTDTDTNAMLNTTIYRSNRSFTMTQTIANGDYSLYFWIGENYRENVRSFNINLEGTTVASDVGTMPMNTWVKLGPFNVTVSDGVLDIEFEQVTFEPHCAGLAIFSQ